MKKRLISVLSAVILVSALALAVNTIQSPYENNEADSNSVTVSYKYTVKDYNGKVAVFSYGSSYPIEILDCPLNSLPADEAARLFEGINITDESQLQALIEAYD